MINNKQNNGGVTAREKLEKQILQRYNIIIVHQDKDKMVRLMQQLQPSK